MDYLLLGISLIAVTLLILFIHEKNANSDAQQTIRTLNSDLNDVKNQQSKAELELSKVEQKLQEVKQQKNQFESNLSQAEANIRVKYQNEKAIQKRALSLERRLLEVATRVQDLTEENHSLQDKLAQHENNLESLLNSNLTSIPWLAGMISDFITYDLEVEAKKLDWGSNIQREKKVASIRAIRAEAKQRIEDAKIASYQLQYLLELYPALSDVIETDFSDLHFTGDIPEYDPVRSWLSREEWDSLSEDVRNQLALDRYVQSRSKSKWQIGRDYELSVGHELINDGFTVDNTGSYLKLEDLGRDIIAQKNGKTYIIQCKHWSEQKVIHEKHIYQLYGTAISYTIENKLSPSCVVPVFVTNISLSDIARRAAKMLNVLVYENHPMKEFPRIKCNIGRDEYGQTRIYHLPMDAQYDNTIIKDPGEFYAYTVSEATAKGFRRAFKWHGG